MEIIMNPKTQNQITAQNSVIDSRDKIEHRKQDRKKKQDKEELLRRFMGIQYKVSGQELVDNYKLNIERCNKLLNGKIKQSVENEQKLHDLIAFNEWAMKHIDIDANYYLDVDAVETQGLAVSKERDRAVFGEPS
jgi:hypothetical protein